jgi:hypothetical protein
MPCHLPAPQPIVGFVESPLPSQKADCMMQCPRDLSSNPVSGIHQDSTGLLPVDGLVVITTIEHVPLPNGCKSRVRLACTSSQLGEGLGGLCLGMALTSGLRKKERGHGSGPIIRSALR